MLSRGLSVPTLVLVLATPGAALQARAQAAIAGASAVGAPGAYLDVLRSRADVEQAAAELARADALFQRQMLSVSEHDDRQAAYRRARLTYVGALLAAAGGMAHVAIDRAVKSRAADGRLRVALTVRNETTPLVVDESLWNVPGVENVDPAAWSAVHGASVSLKTDAGPNGATISQPYERVVPALAPHQARTIEFDLLDDVTDVVVAISAAGRLDERRIRLEVGSATNALAVDAAQSSIEGELGAQVVYELRLDRPRPSGGPARLAVRGLPADVAYEFRNPDGRTRLSQLRFADGATSARIQLAVSLPTRPSAAVRPDVPLAFDVVAGDEPGVAGSGSGVAAGLTRLELVPRGVPRLELRPSTFAVEAATEGVTTLALAVRNGGSGRVGDVRLRAELPPRWRATFSPASLAMLAPGDERHVTLTLQPPVHPAVGDYEIRVGIDDATAAKRLDVEDKIVRVHVTGGGGMLGTLLGATGALALTLLLVVRGRRWVNR